MIDTYKLRNVLEMLVFVIVNILFSDLLIPIFSWFVFFFTALLLMLLNSYNLFIWNLVCLVFIIVVLVFRFTGLVFIYDFFEQNAQNPKITAFIHKLKEKTNIQLTIWLLTWLSITIFYIPTLFSFVDKYKFNNTGISIGYVIAIMCVIYFALNSFATLFLYWKICDNGQYKINQEGK